MHKTPVPHGAGVLYKFCIPELPCHMAEQAARKREVKNKIGLYW